MVRILLLSFLFIRPALSDSTAFFTLATGDEPSLIEGADFSKLAEFASAAVVDIEIEQETNVFMSDPFFQSFLFGFGHELRPGKVRGSGSAVLINETGLMVSCAHVCKDATKITVHLTNGQKYDAKIVAAYPIADLAFLQISPNSPTTFPYLKIASTKNLKNGMPIAALGNSFSLGQNFTNGIISATKRRLRLSSESVVPSVLQHNAAVNPGNSGGALVDKAGNLIGLNNAIYSKTGGSTGVAFAIPSDIIVAFLKKHQHNPDNNTDLYLGIQKLEPCIVEETGGAGLKILALDSTVTDLKVGDIIVSINDVTIDSESAYLLVEETALPNEPLSFDIYRDQKKQTLSITPQHVKKNAATFTIDNQLFQGITFSPLPQKIKSQLNLDYGLLIKTPQSKKSIEGLFSMFNTQLFEPGDILLKINDVKIVDKKTLSETLSQATDPLIIDYIRGEAHIRQTISGFRSSKSRNTSQKISQKKEELI